MRDARVPKGVYTSTVAVLGDTRGALVDERHVSNGPFLTEYDRTKWKAHYEVAVPMIQAGLPLVIAMPGVVYGPGDTGAVHACLTRLLRGRMPFAPAGSRFSFGYIEDTARGLIQAMDAGCVGESYLLTGSVHGFDELLDVAARLANRRPPFLRPGPAVLRSASALLRLLERVNLARPASAELPRLLAGTTWIGSSAKAQRALGFNPRQLEEGLRPTIEHELRALGMA
jgi:nucleoside-diphosphate-sugar epimerase